jgi:hypothetical protein
MDELQGAFGALTTYLPEWFCEKLQKKLVLENKNFYVEVLLKQMTSSCTIISWLLIDETTQRFFEFELRYNRLSKFRQTNQTNNWIIAIPNKTRPPKAPVTLPTALDATSTFTHLFE